MQTRAVLTLEDCEEITAAAQAEARRNKWTVAIAVLDDGGHLLHFVRMDGATPANATIALEKARTSALSRRPSDFWEQRIRDGRLAMLKMPGILPVQGGLPIFVNGAASGRWACRACSHTKMNRLPRQVSTRWSTVRMEAAATDWMVYIVRCADGSLYTGISVEVSRRVEEHNASDQLGARYTRSRRPVELVYRESVDSRSAAVRREREIKRLTRQKKEALVASSPQSAGVIGFCSP